MKVSIILPSHNKFNQLVLTLYALELQKFDKRNMEVIVVDDHSTDLTRAYLQKYRPKYSLKYIHLPQRNGASTARNKGIEVATGEIILMLDAENLVDPNFVARHVKYHQGKENLVVTGSIFSKHVYTVLYPDSTSNNIIQFYSTVKHLPGLLKRWKFSLTNHQKNMNYVIRFMKRRKTPKRLLLKSDIKAMLYKKMAFGQHQGFDQVVSQYGDDYKYYAIPWTFLITRNVSIRKSFLDSVGYFNEAFNQGWAMEDWELGYRLYKAGAEFLVKKDLVCYHQEHPENPYDKHRSWLINNYVFQKLHPVFEVYLLSLLVTLKRDLTQINEIIREYNDMVLNHPNEFIHFRESLNLFLKEMGRLLAESQSASNLMWIIGIESNLALKERIITEAYQLKMEEKYPKLVDLFTELYNL